MRPSPSVLAATVLAASLGLAGCGSDEFEAPSDFFLPIGDAAAGRQAFIELRCHYCHEVAADAEMPGLVGAREGPAIGERQLRFSRERVAQSIIAPNHEMPPLMREPISPMGDYGRAMTVRQFIDVVAFVSAGGKVEG